MSVDVLVIGATGHTGKLIARYLSHHARRESFTLGLAARSRAKLDALCAEYDIEKSVVELFVVDLLDERQVDATVSHAKVVISAASPYHFVGDNVVKACLNHKAHYVDIAGELVWTRSMILRFEDEAKKAGITMVNLCGFDVVPSDAAVYLARKTLTAHSPKEHLGISTSKTCFQGKGGFSKGSMDSVYAMFDTVPMGQILEGMNDQSVSPIPGKMYGLPKPFYSMVDPKTGKTLVGGMFPLSPLNRAMMRRTWALLELADSAGLKSAPSFGPDFVYDEFIETPNRLIGALLSASLIMVTTALAIWPLRLLIKWFFSQGMGDVELDLTKLEEMSFSLVNVTTSTMSMSTQRPIVVRTTIHGKGEPAYFLTSILISESALCLLPESRHRLPPLGRQGGILTPMTAFGDVLIDKLKAGGRFEFTSEVVDDPVMSHGHRGIGVALGLVIAIVAGAISLYFKLSFS